MAVFDELMSDLREYGRTAAGFIMEDFPGGVLGFTATCLTSYLTARYVYNSYQLSKTKKKIQRRQAKARQNIENLRQRVSKKKCDVRITTLPFSELHAKLQSGELSACAVLLAFQVKALEVNDRLNCITEFIESAEKRAADLDAIDPKDRGPLHGIPVSIKESVGVEGTDCTAGVAKFIDQKMPEDGALLKMLIKQGAVPFARTNLSQCMANASCNNPIFGESKNPVQNTRTCGGSSGGEGALIGGGGSILGVGCDMGGSNRIPSHFCGIVGVKVTPYRLTNHGNYNFGCWVKTISEVYSPMGKDVDSVVTFLRATIQPALYTFDPLLPQVPWREEIYASSKPLKIGFFTKIGGVEPIPAVTRAVLTAKQNLERMGHKVVEFTPPDVLYAFEALVLAVIMGDNGEEFQEIMKHDIVDPQNAQLFMLLQFPYFVRCLMAKLVASIPAEACAMQARFPRKILDWWHKNEEKEVYIRKFIAEMEKLGVDALISPTFPFPAWPLGDEERNISAMVYTALYNALDFPCGSVPATTVDAKDVENMKNYPKNNAYEKYVHRICEGAEGMPIGVQCATLPYQEEMLLRLMKDLESSFKSMA